MPDRSEDALRAEIRDLQAQLASRMARSDEDAALYRKSAKRLDILEVVLDTVPVGVILADAKGRIVHGNRHVEQLVGHPVLYSEDVDDYAEWVSFHAGGQRVESHEYPLSRVLRDGEEQAEIDVHYQRGDGTRVWIRIIGRPVLDESGDTIGATVAVLDIDRERRLQDMQQVLIDELDHRVKNAFSVVKSIVGQSLRKADTPPELRLGIDGRLDAYADAHAKLIGSSWDKGTVEAIAGDMLAHIGEGRIDMQGPKVELPSRLGLSLYMAFYELATNAVKYGSLSVPDGSVTLSWSLTGEGADRRLVFAWTERGGPVPVEPQEVGFGSFLTERAVSAETHGKAKTLFARDGVEWSLEMPWTEQKADRQP